MKILRSLTIVTLAFYGQALLALSARGISERQNRIPTLQKMQPKTAAEAKAQQAELQRITNELESVPVKQKAMVAPVIAQAKLAMEAKAAQVVVMEKKQAVAQAQNKEAPVSNKLANATKTLLAKLDASKLPADKVEEVKDMVAEMNAAAESNAPESLIAAAGKTNDLEDQAKLIAGAAAAQTNNASQAAAIVAATVADKVEDADKLKTAVDALTSGTKANTAAAVQDLIDLSDATDDPTTKAVLQVAAQTAKQSPDQVVNDAIATAQANPATQNDGDAAAISNATVKQNEGSLLMGIANLLTLGMAGSLLAPAEKNDIQKATDNVVAAAKEEEKTAENTNKALGELSVSDAKADAATAAAEAAISEFGPEAAMPELTRETVEGTFAGISPVKQTKEMRTKAEMTPWNENAQQALEKVESLIAEISRLQAHVEDSTGSFWKTEDTARLEAARNSQIKIAHEIQKLIKGALMGFTEGSQDNTQLRNNLGGYLSTTRVSLENNNFFDQVHQLKNYEESSPDLYEKLFKPFLDEKDKIAREKKK